MRPKFFNLQHGALHNLKDGAALDTWLLEHEMLQYNRGMKLSKLKPASIDDSLAWKFVPYFYVNGRDSREIVRLADKYPRITGPCAMSLSSLEELSEHMSAAYHVAHFNYILGTKYYPGFPDLWCGASSGNVLLSLMEFGYPNAAYAFSKEHNHGYVILPFVFENQNIKGAVIIDPTYDQLWQAPAARNAVFIKLGMKWQYRTEWESNSNLFPSHLCSIDVLRKTGRVICEEKDRHKGGAIYLKRAFENPIAVERPSYQSRDSSVA